MEAAEVARDVVEVVDDLVVGQRRPEHAGQVGGDGAVASTEQQRGPATLAPVAVHRDHGVDVVEEGGQRGRLRRPVPMRWHVPLQVGRQHDGIQRRTGALGRLASDDVGLLLQRPAVQRHEPDVRAQLDDFAHAGLGQEFT
jgi:hypothetical protein